MDPNFEVTESGGGLTFALADGSRFQLPAGPGVARVGSLDLRACADGAFDEAGQLLREVAKVARNPRLSEVGKREVLAPVATKAVQMVARCAASIERESEALDKAEVDLLAVPQLDRQDAVGALEDRELRDRFVALPARRRLHVVETIAEPENERLMFALLRDPWRSGDPLLEGVAARWRAKREAESAAAFRELRTQRESLEWTRRAVYSAAAAVRRGAGLSPRELGSAINADALARRGSHAFSATDEVAQARRMG